jgi:hypothetical protein
MKKEFYYSVQNGGDGSAYPSFMESMELAEWDQDNMSEGWGESCTGSITVSSDSEMSSTNVKTALEYYKEKFEGSYPEFEEEEERLDFVAKILNGVDPKNQ